MGTLSLLQKVAELSHHACREYALSDDSKAFSYHNSPNLNHMCLTASTFLAETLSGLKNIEAQIIVGHHGDQPPYGFDPFTCNKEQMGHINHAWVQVLCKHSPLRAYVDITRGQFNSRGKYYNPVVVIPLNTIPSDFHEHIGFSKMAPKDFRELWPIASRPTNNAIYAISSIYHRLDNGVELF